MKAPKNYLPHVIKFLFLGSLVLVCIIFINSLAKTQQIPGQKTQQPASSAYPPPKQNASTSYPPSPIKTSPEISPTAIFSHFTPYPTLTLRPGPSPTLIPIITSAKNSEGDIIFFAKTSDKGLANPQILNIDARGNATNSQMKLSEAGLQSDSLVFSSPDGKYLAVIGGWGNLELFNIAKRNFEKIAENQVNVQMFYNWFPDNRQILYGIYSLSLGDPNSGSSAPLAVPGYGGITGAAASPDGQYVVYSYSEHKIYTEGLWIINSNGQNAHLFANVTAPISNISWSPDGKKIAFFGNGWQVINADGSNLRQVATGLLIPQCYFIPPLWSPDSLKIAVVTEETGGSFCHGWRDENYKGTNIMLVDVDSGKPRPLLSDGSTGNIDPTWSPDGSQIAFVSNRSGSPEIWAVNVDGTNLRQLSTGNVLARYPVWRRANQ